jgi:large conductance mechanosensitive channel
MGMIKEFKDFALKGSLVDTAIAFVMGAVVGKLVSAFIDGLVMPLVGMIQGKDFSNMYIGLNDASKAAADAGAPLAKAKEAGPVWAYGNFITVAIEFLMVAFVMFMIIKAINASKKKEAAAAPPPPPEDVTLLREIRDALKK